jgi:hypothetical protein
MDNDQPGYLCMKFVDFASIYRSRGRLADQVEHCDWYDRERQSGRTHAIEFMWVESHDGQPIYGSGRNAAHRCVKSPKLET